MTATLLALFMYAHLAEYWTFTRKLSLIKMEDIVMEDYEESSISWDVQTSFQKKVGTLC